VSTGAVEYRYTFFLVLVAVVFGGLSIGAVVLAVGLLPGGSGPPVAFSLFWLLAYAWNGYWYMWRMAYVVTLEDGRLRWRAPLHGGEVRLADVVELRPMRMGSQIEVVKLRSRRPILLFVSAGLDDFAAELTRQVPDVQVRFGWGGRRAFRTRPRGWGWRRRALS